VPLRLPPSILSRTFALTSWKLWLTPAGLKHRKFVRSNAGSSAYGIENVRRLDQGAERVLDRTCLEYDVICSSSNVGERCVGRDVTIIVDAGAYDVNMIPGERR
jgi:hypothetical protein